MQAKPRDGGGVDTLGWALATQDPCGEWDPHPERRGSTKGISTHTFGANGQCVRSPRGAALSFVVGLVTSLSPGLTHGDSVGYFTRGEAPGEGQASFRSADGCLSSLWVLSCPTMGSLSWGHREDYS